MRKQTAWMVIVGVFLTLAVAAGAFVMLRTVNDPVDTGQATALEDAGSLNTDALLTEVGERPDCPASGVGGVELECLGGENAPEASTGLSVVNVWAWWCGPCRDELPYFDEFAAAHAQYSVVGVHADQNPGNGAAMLDELGISLASYQDLNNAFAGELGLPGVIPITVVFDGDEQLKIFPRTFGSAAEIESAVAEAVAGR